MPLPDPAKTTPEQRLAAIDEIAALVPKMDGRSQFFVWQICEWSKTAEALREWADDGFAGENPVFPPMDLPHAEAVLSGLNGRLTAHRAELRRIIAEAEAEISSCPIDPAELREAA